MIRVAALILAPGTIGVLAGAAIRWVWLDDVSAHHARNRRAARDCATRRRAGRREHP